MYRCDKRCGEERGREHEEIEEKEGERERMRSAHWHFNDLRCAGLPLLIRVLYRLKSELSELHSLICLRGWDCLIQPLQTLLTSSFFLSQLKLLPKYTSGYSWWK